MNSRANSILAASPIRPDCQKNNDKSGLLCPLLTILTVVIFHLVYLPENYLFGLLKGAWLLEKTGGLDYLLESQNFSRQLGVMFAFGQSDRNLSVLIQFILVAFLLHYYAPFRFKPAVTVGAFLLAFCFLYGLQPGLDLTCLMLLFYLVFHPKGASALRVSAIVVPLFFCFGLDLSQVGFSDIASLCACACLFMSVYLGIRYLSERYPAFYAYFRLLFVHGFVALPLLRVIIPWELQFSLGLLLGFWFWFRLLLYNADVEDGAVQARVGVLGFLSSLFHPAALVNWAWSAYIGQGGAYASNRFLARAKDQIIYSGLSILWLSLGYLLFEKQAWIYAANLLDLWFGVTIYPSTKHLIAAYVNGKAISQSVVLMSTLFDQLHWVFFWGAVVHFKVGIWRIFGYDFEPHFNKPWLATNLVEFWKRFAFHYRAFLARLFYYPVFLGLRGRSRRLRILSATFAAATVGNMIWGHLNEPLLYHNGGSWENVLAFLPTWPYYLLLGSGIGVTEMYLSTRKKRYRPWSDWRRFPVDLLACYLTWQYFSLIHVFARPVVGGNLELYFSLFLKGLGL